MIYLGKFIKEVEKKTINNYINNYLDATNEYAKYLTGSPSFSTYYSINLESSTKDLGLENVTDIIGNESPIKYNKIDNFPLYIESEMTFSQLYEEDSGYNAEFEGTAVVLAGTIIPQTDDVFIIDYLEKRFLFRVTQVETSNTTMRTFYRITFVLSAFDLEILNDRQVKEEYDTIYQNIGTELSAIIPLRTFTMIDDFEREVNRLSKKYIQYYYDEKINCFIFNREKMNSLDICFYKNNNIYDPKLAIFIKNNEIFINDKTFMKNIFIDTILDSRDLDYEQSLYALLETKDMECYDYEAYYFNSLKESVFGLMNAGYHELIHNKTVVFKCHCKNCENSIKNGLFTECDLKKYVRNTKLKIDTLDYKEQILIIYLRLNNEVKQNNISDYYEDILKVVQNIKIQKDLFTYLLIPCVIYILKDVQKRLMYKNDNN